MNFQILCPFLSFICPFSEKSHACPYFLELALGMTCCDVYSGAPSYYLELLDKLQKHI